MTSLVDSVAQQISGNVPALAGAIQYIADLAALIAQQAMPQREICAFVVPLGFDDKGSDAAAGLYTQMISESVGVVLCIKALGDATARKALPTIDALSTDVINAVAGWAPDDVAGVFRVIKGRMLSVTKGLVLYQIDFALTDQLRIAR